MNGINISHWCGKKL